MKHDAITAAAIPAGSFSPEKNDTRVGAETLREAKQRELLASGANGNVMSRSGAIGSIGAGSIASAKGA